MKLLIISHVVHKVNDEIVFAYAPYVREMNLWLKHVDSVEVIAPTEKNKANAIEIAYHHDHLNLNRVPAIQFTSIKQIFFSCLKLPIILIILFKACKRADHIHLRCPGNMGLLGCFVQLFFSKKMKTAKYAGNWDPNSKQPLTYRIQKWILGNPMLTKNMQVLVYGDWPNQTKNIKSFFTATYHSSEIESLSTRSYTSKLKFVFVGSLVIGKRPLLAIQVIESLIKMGHDVTLDVFGDGNLKPELLLYISENDLDNYITIHGNQSKEIVKTALKNAHFSILPSKSEGWSKAIAEAMFFGAIPIVTKISCVPYMLDGGNRGILIEPELNEAVKHISNCLKNKENLRLMSEKAMFWSQKYTLDVFEIEIGKLINN